ncbi:MAG: ribosome small subunit-dependent GTPase A [Magnetococcales bacterium]|nr:ribosome small subunit-dependent GTPase A [Magnetococcales bacterium]
MPRKTSEKQLSLRQMARMRVARGIRVAHHNRIDQDQDRESGISDENSPQETGRVVAHFGLNVEVEDATGARFRCAVREALLNDPVCGDEVIWQRVGDSQGVIVALRERRSMLQRPGPYQRLLTVAANVDRIVVVAAGNGFNPGLVDRYLVAAGKAGIRPVLVINKMDLVTDPALLEAALQPYGRMGYGVFQVSVLLDAGLTTLEEALAGLTAVFVGESGVGKSSLVGRWVQDETLKTAEVHSSTGQGRHATTTARLYRLPRGGLLIDSPGVREFGLHGVVREEIPGLFLDMRPFLGSCRFSDCRHLREPGCALRGAVASGDVSEIRLASLLRLMESVPSKNPFGSPGGAARDGNDRGQKMV